jgi:hypothetical protein
MCKGAKGGDIIASLFVRRRASEGGWVVKPTEKCCTKCGETKPLDQFGAESKRSDGRSSWCKACKRQRRRERYAAVRQYVFDDVRRTPPALSGKTQKVPKYKLCVPDANELIATIIAAANLDVVRSTPPALSGITYKLCVPDADELIATIIAAANNPEVYLRFMKAEASE